MIPANTPRRFWFCIASTMRPRSDLDEINRTLLNISRPAWPLPVSFERHSNAERPQRRDPLRDRRGIVDTTLGQLDDDLLGTKPAPAPLPTERLRVGSRRG